MRKYGRTLIRHSIPTDVSLVDRPTCRQLIDYNPATNVDLDLDK